MKQLRHRTFLIEADVQGEESRQTRREGGTTLMALSPDLAISAIQGMFGLGTFGT